MKKITIGALILAAGILGALLGGSQSAVAVPLPQVVSHTIQAVTVNELMAINISRQTDGQGGTAILATGVFDLKDGSGNIVDTGTVTVTLTAGQVSSLNTFSNAVLVPAMNAQ